MHPTIENDPQLTDFEDINLCQSVYNVTFLSKYEKEASNFFEIKKKKSNYNFNLKNKQRNFFITS